MSAVLIVRATANEDATYTYITSSGVANAYDTNNAINGTAGKPNPIYRVKFQTSALVAKAGQEVSIFAYCNPSPELAKEIADGNWNVDMSESIVAADNDAIWTPNSFLMTSALPASKILPSEFDMNNTYNKVQTPFNLGTVQVERVAARFDYAVTTEVNGEKLTADNCFPIYDYVPEENLEEGEGAVKPTIQGYVTITDLALINEAKNFYLLPRVAANTGEGKDAMADMSKVTILGKEDPTNWVISPSTQDYFYQLVEGFNPAAPGTLNFTSVSSLTEECNTENWVNATKEYKIWRYTTENTIRSVAAQKRGITTGVVFRGEISGVEGSALGESIKSGKAIYAHDGIMYGNLDSLMNYVSRNPRSGVSIDFQT
ncbi:MAG: hypothetical protein K2M05_06740, partial [Paramuribaculum sp.]|nr:hypothetical protein [Paramuribaculum sp.]